MFPINVTFVYKQRVYLFLQLQEIIEQNMTVIAPIEYPLCFQFFMSYFSDIRVKNLKLGSRPCVCKCLNEFPEYPQ